MKIVVPGGSGRVGRILCRAFAAREHEVVVLTRGASRVQEGVRYVAWDGRTLGSWATEIDGADAVVNLAGRDVNCRYSTKNLRDMLDSRVDSTRVVGQAISAAAKPPRVWLQASTATIYSHHTDQPHDDVTGVLGGDEPDLPRVWKASIDIAKAWERALDEADTPDTRRVAMRTAIVMSPDSGSPFRLILGLTRLGLGGWWGSGRQYVSWVHDRDLVRAVYWLLNHDDLSGPVNIASSGPLPQRDFIREVRRAARVPIGLPATAWMLEIGTFAMRTETELILKSRRVVPQRIVESGFRFDVTDWRAAARDLVARSAR